MGTPAPIKRAILIVLDGVGAGAAPDAKEYGDPGADTLGHVSAAHKSLRLPNLERWGVGNLTKMPTVPTRAPGDCVASFGRCRELSKGKDTTSGHWEMAGIVVETPFATFPNGFPAKIVERWVRENNLPGVLGNVAASGTEIIKQLGEEHVRTGKPILYTSADSVWQIAAHEESFGLDRLNAISKSARKICDELQISRVISRPFVGKSVADFKRTHHRKDLSQTPPSKTMMEHVIDAGLPSIGIGKIWNIFNGRGIQESLETEDNADGLRVLNKALGKYDRGLLFVNLIDFDMLYGHRRDVPGFARALEEFDAFIPQLEKKLSADDLVIISADHGNDPTYRGTDHTREHVPLLAFRKGAAARALGDRDSFADIGQTIVHALTGRASLAKGSSFLGELQS
jgi:phosphopentomutase